MSEPFIGEIRIFGFTYAPRSWAFCDGQVLSIAQNTALFSLLGTTYGGDGRTTFNLPDLRGRAPIHHGNGPGLNTYQLGQKGGAETVTLTANEMPSHTHSIQAVSGIGDAKSPTGNFLAQANDGEANFSTSGATAYLNPNACTVAGGSQAHSNLPPYLAINFSIALVGIYPSRS